VKISDVPGIGPKKLKALEQSGITRIYHLVHFVPRSYIDRMKPLKISSVQHELEMFSSIATIRDVTIAGGGRAQRLEVIFDDQSGTFKGVWFKGVQYFKKSLKPGVKVLVWGKLKRFGSWFSMAHPDIEVLKDDNFNFDRFLPVYPGGAVFDKSYIKSTDLQKWILYALDKISYKEFLPADLISEFELPDHHTALQWLHKPETPEHILKAQERLKIEELLLFQLAIYRYKQSVSLFKEGPKLPPPYPLTEKFKSEVLPFTLTGGQENAVADIQRDLTSGRLMNRLLQGDVGAGKTMVAVISMLMAIDHGFQCAFMAPTEILAEQHAKTLQKFLDPVGVEVRLLISNQTKRQRNEILMAIAGGQASVVVGTHAVFQDAVEYNNLGFVVIDEQHRFGVAQRAQLLAKSAAPHVLVMSATPIPRSLALTVYGDLDVSVIKSLPKGRKPIKTAVRRDKHRPDIYQFIKNALLEGDQVYVVYPLVEESEALDLKDATQGFEQLTEIFPDFNVGLVHGRMDSEQKDETMEAFRKGDVHVLVSTTVIEVGVDVPNASIMIIEHAERFGLSQLHQLRGRVGRGSKQSFCILLAGEKLSEHGRKRLKTMVDTTDGFKISEVDLEIRGPGDLLGTKQSGLPEFKFADIIEDQELMIEMKRKASEILDDDPELDDSSYENLKPVFENYYKKRLENFSAN
jgi:ATP-dependent DNA helicase RecG